MTLRLPARWCRPSTFWVMRVKRGKRFSISTRARWAGLGWAEATSLRRQSYHSQTRRGLLRKARGVASSSGLNLAHRPVWASRKVGTPLSAETPAPVRTTTDFARARRSMSCAGKFMRQTNFFLADCGNGLNKKLLPKFFGQQLLPDLPDKFPA